MLGAEPQNIYVNGQIRVQKSWWFAGLAITVVMEELLRDILMLGSIQFRSSGLDIQPNFHMMQQSNLESLQSHAFRSGSRKDHTRLKD
jgi:hypothetical protein